MKKYDTYYPVDFEYVKQLPEGWKLLPNIAIFDNRNEKGFPDEELLSVTISKGVIKQSELDKKDSSNSDKSNYKLVKQGDIVYSMRFRQGACGHSAYRGLVSNVCQILKPKMQTNPLFFHYQFRLPFYKNYAKRYSYGIADGQFPLRWKEFKRMYSIVPPYQTQNIIVEKLIGIDKIFEVKIAQIEKIFGKRITIQSEIIEGNFYDSFVTKLITGEIEAESIRDDELKFVL